MNRIRIKKKIMIIELIVAGLLYLVNQYQLPVLL